MRNPATRPTRSDWPTRSPARPLIEVPGARHTDIVGPVLIDRIATFLDEAVTC